MEMRQACAALPIRRTYPWGHENLELIEYHKKMIRIHKEHPVFTHGSFRFLYGEHNCISYGRFDETEQIVVIFYNGTGEKNVVIPVWTAEVPNEAELETLVCTEQGRVSLEPVVYPVTKGELAITMRSKMGIVLKYRKQG